MYYLDTSIWLDYYLKRGKNGSAALQLLFNASENNFKIFYSDLILKELKKLGFSAFESYSIMRIVNDRKKITTTKIQLKEAKKLASQRNVPLGDALHAILARDNEAILISRDSHFKKLKDLVKVQIPEDLI